MTENIIAHTVDGERTKDVLIEENVTFQNMFLSLKCLEGLTKCGFQKPSPIQLKAIPLGRCGFDLIVKSKSGTGKTIVFSVVALEMIDLTSSNIQVLILAPTREIAVQIADTLKAVGSPFTGLVIESFIGGLPEKDDINRVQNCQIAVGAPGRIKSLIKQNILDVSNVKLFVLDEADKLMQTSFQNDVTEIYHKLPLKKQIIAASATYPNDLDQFLRNYMQSPTYVRSDSNTQLLLGLKHFIKEVKTSTNSAQEMKFKNEELLKLLSNISFTQCIIFSNYQTRAENISITINRNGWNSLFISAAQSQPKRLEVIEQLKNFKCRILLSTDLTARGIDVSNVDLVINYDVPIDVSTYLHRMGRAGRYGSKGICISLVSGEKDLLQMKKFLGNIGGTNLSISKLDDVEKGIDLWADDESKFEKISGIVNNDDDIHTIKNEVLSLKNTKEVVGKKNETTKTKKKNKDCINDSPTNDTNKSSSLEQDDSDLTGAKLECSNSDLTEKKVYDNDCLKSLAEGTFDFSNVLSPSKISFGEIKNKDDTSNKNNDGNMDSNSLLRSLAEGTFDFQNIPSPVKEKSDAQLAELVKNQKTRKSSELETEVKGKISKNEIFIKNVGRYEIAKILVNDADIDSTMETIVSDYLNILEKPDSSETTRTNNLIESQHSTSEQNSVSEENQQSYKDNIFMVAYLHSIEKETVHWKSVVKDDEVFSINQQSGGNNKLEEKMMEDNDEEIEEDYHVNIEEDYEEELGENYMEEMDPNVVYDENGYEYIPNRMVWMPVEEDTSEKYKSIPPINLLENDTSENSSPDEISIMFTPEGYPFEGSEYDPSMDPNILNDIWCNFSDINFDLWEKGANFYTKEAFLEYHNNWQRRLRQVRENTSQTIYDQLMKKHQKNL